MAAVHPFPGVPQIEYRDHEDNQNQTFIIEQDFELDWPASNFQAMSLRTNASMDMDLTPEMGSHRNAGIQRCMKTPDRHCGIDAPLAWQTGFSDWHGRHSPLPYGLNIPNHGSLGSHWTPIDQDTTCSGGSTWSPRTSDSRSEVDGYLNHQLSPEHDMSGLGIGYTKMGGQNCFPEYPGPGCARVISPHDLQQYPDPEEYPDDGPMRADIHEITISGSCSPEHAGLYPSYGRPEQFGPEDEAIGSSIQNESKAPSVQDEEDSTMGESPEYDDDDDYSPITERRDHGRRLSQRSVTLKNPAQTPKRPQRVRNTTSQTAKPTKIAKSSSKSSASSPTVARNANTLPCSHCSSGFSSESTLKKHVLAFHTRPFICTFHGYGCSSTVGSKNEWKRHINVQHMHLETWRCDIGACAPQSCGSKEHNHASPSPSAQLEAQGSNHHEFDRKDLFTQHLKRMHSPAHSASRAEKAKFEASVEGIQKRCHRKLRDPPTNSICPYCPGHQAFENWDDRIEHVGKHLEKGDFDKSTEAEDLALQDWLSQEGYLVWRGPGTTASGWKLLDTGKKRRRGDKASEEGEEDAEGEDE